MKLVMSEDDKNRLLNYYVAPTTRGHEYLYDGIGKLSGNESLKRELMNLVRVQTKSLEQFYDLIERSVSVSNIDRVIPVYGMEVKD